MHKARHVMLTVSLVLGILLAAAGIAFAEAKDAGKDTMKDIRGHWAESSIRVAAEKGLLAGYTDKTFKPDKTMTRAEYFALINRTFGFNKAAVSGDNDIFKNAWFAGEILKAKAQGYLDILEEPWQPNQPVTRQEVVAILGQVLKLIPDEEAANEFVDVHSFAPWARGYIGALSSKGYVKGYVDNSFGPARNISRAEVAAMIHRSMGELYNSAGNYGFDENQTTINGNVTVNQPNVALKNMVINGDLYLTEGIGEGSVDLEQVTVLGRTIISGGGKGVFIKDSSINKITVSAPDEFRLRLIAQGTSQVGAVHLQSGVKLEEVNLTGLGFGDVWIVGPEGAEVTLEGNFDQVLVKAALAQISILKGAISHLECNAKDAVITIDKEHKIQKLTVNQPAQIKGKCDIETANINASNVSIEAAPKKCNQAKGITGVKTGTKSNTKGSGGGNHSGGGSPGKTKSITQIEPLVKITVAHGTSRENINLPGSVKVGLSDNTEKYLAVNWDSGTPAYDGNTAGSYTFSGSLDLPAGISNPSGYLAEITVDVESPDEDTVTVEKVNVLKDLYPVYGTTLDEVLPPGKAEVMLSNNETMEVDVTWGQGSLLDGNLIAATYNLTGTLELPNHVTNPYNLMAELKVILYHTGLDYIKNIDPNPGTGLNTSPGITLFEFDSSDEWLESDNAQVQRDDIKYVSGGASGRLLPAKPVEVSWDGNDYKYYSVMTGPVMNNLPSAMDNIEFNLYIPTKGQIDFIVVNFYTDRASYSYFEHGIGDWELSPGWNKIRRTRDNFAFHGGLAGLSTMSLGNKLILSGQQAELQRKVHAFNNAVLAQKKSSGLSGMGPQAATGGSGWDDVTNMEIMVVYKEGMTPIINMDRVACDVRGEPKLMFTFDDAWYDVVEYGYPILEDKGFKATLWANKEEAVNAGNDPARVFMNEDDLEFLYQDGWDVGNHTVNHPDTQLSDDEMRRNYEENQEWLLENNWDPGAYHVCYPSGSYSERLIEMLRDIGVKSGRTTEYGIQPTPVTNIYKLKCVAIGRDTDVNLIKSEIERAIKTGSSIFFMLHRVEESPEPDDGRENYGQLAVSTVHLGEIVDFVDGYVKAGKIDVMTVSEWYELYIKG